MLRTKHAHKLPLAAVFAVTLVAAAFLGGGRAEGQDARLLLDTDITNGSGPCEPVDQSSTVAPGSEFQMAVCLTDAEQPPGAFNFELLYDTALFKSPNVGCSNPDCLDSNPDANAGNTVWGGSLGTGWDCDFLEVNPPLGDKDGKASMTCLSILDLTLPVGQGVSSPLAVVSFEAGDGGSGEFQLVNTAIYDMDSIAIVRCTGMNDCSSSSVDVSKEAPARTPGAGGGTPGAGGSPGPSGGGAAGTVAPGETVTSAPQSGTPLPPTAAAQATATAAAAAAGEGGGTAAAKTPGKGSATASTESDEDGGGDSALIVIAAVAGVAVVGGAGWFAWRRFHVG